MEFSLLAAFLEGGLVLSYTNISAISEWISFGCYPRMRKDLKTDIVKKDESLEKKCHFDSQQIALNAPQESVGFLDANPDLHSQTTWLICTRWAPTSYKWSYNPYK